jgi:hypothetical protein
MNPKSTNSIPTNDTLRCQHRSPSGRRCRRGFSDALSGLCSQHARLHQKQTESAEVTGALTADTGDFKSASQINDFLSRLLALLAQKRISPRHAGVMAYISSLHLRTLPAIEHELNPESSGEQRIVIDLPRPNRDPDAQPS